MNKKSFILLPVNSEWRWYCEHYHGNGDNMLSPWYPTAHILRQKEFQDWQYPLQLLRQYLFNL